jgi:transcription elongation factor GreB
VGLNNLSNSSSDGILMSKAFTKENEVEDDEPEEGASPLPVGSKNYITPGGHQRLKDEFQYLLKKDRPMVTAAVSWAAKNGDRSENADYQYGKKRLREIDRRLRFLTKRLDIAEEVDPAAPRETEMADQVFFGATVTYAHASGQENTITIVGVDEIDLTRNQISWISPLARALMKARPGDAVMLRAPSGVEELDVIDVRYVPIEVEKFVPVAALFTQDKAT